jgi:hypothetical protein
VSLPSDFYSLLVFALLVLPGIVYAAVRRSVSGFSPHDSSVATRLLQAALVGALIDLVYLTVFGNVLLSLVPRSATQEPEHPHLLVWLR